MGAIKTSEQPGGIIGLEITYGGKDAPFGGIDASMPPRYIEPNCFVDTKGFLVSSGELRAFGWKQANITLLEYDTASMTFLGAGNFFSNGKYWNWALAYNSVYTPPSGPALLGFTTTTYHIWTWPSGTTGNIAKTDDLAVQQYDKQSNATSAIARVSVAGIPATGPGTLLCTLIGPSGAITPSMPFAAGDTPVQVMQNFAAHITAVAGPDFTAFFDTDVKIVAVVPGVAGNSDVISIGIYEHVGLNPTLLNGFQGGSDGVLAPQGLPIDPLSWTTVGETIYFGGPGTMILKFKVDATIGPQFEVLTQYLGAVTLYKYNGQLLAGGIIPGPGLVLDDPEMIIAWSAPEGQYGIWNPLDADGNVTGAGFNQEADIADYITGLLIIPGAAAILRTQGVDYVTALQNGVSPFDFQHISNAKKGEGCQDSRMITQYDQAGMFIGNSDVYVFDGKMNPVGEKIRNYLYPDVAVNNHKSAESVALAFDGDTSVYSFFVLGNMLYIFNMANKTWVRSLLFVEDLANPIKMQLAVFADFTNAVTGTQFYNNFTPYLVSIVTAGIQFWSFTPTVQANETGFFAAPDSSVFFPEEEISFGRDVTVDALLVSMAGSPGQQVTFTVTGYYSEGNDSFGTLQTVSVTFVLPGTATDGRYDDYKLYFNEEIFTGRNPQLSYTLPLGANGERKSFSIEKIAMFATFDPNQRPV